MTDDEMKRALELANYTLRQRHEDPVLRETADTLARCLLALIAECERMTKYVAHNDEEYATMKDVLRAEHEECQRLRAVIDRVSMLVLSTQNTDEDRRATLDAIRAAIAAARKAGG